MRASELRIGNLVYQNGIDYDAGDNKFHDPDGDEIIEVCRLNSNMINSLGEEDCSPIPLTEEWLLKFGFEAQNGWYVLLRSSGDGFSVRNERSGTFEYMTGLLQKVHVKYVHQLQNLYFTLTGEELTINPNATH
jgi:hypothetical protein